MRISINRLSSIYAYIVILSLYSFGTFVFFNLFGLAYVAKIICIIGSLFGLYYILIQRYSYIQRINISFIAIFFIYFGLSLAFDGITPLLSVFQVFPMFVLVLYLLYVDMNKINLILKGVINITFVFVILGFFVFFVYAIDPDQLNFNSKSYNMPYRFSNLGNNDLITGSYLDYLSLTSGGHYSLFGEIVTRVKGYSNEPSSTIVHYLPPVVFAMMYSGKTKIKGIVILLFSLVAISSAMGVIIIILSFFIYILFKMKSNKVRILTIVMSSFAVAILMLYSTQLIEFIAVSGQVMNESFSYDLLSRKEGSSSQRLSSYNSAVLLISEYPFGFSGGNTMTGLWTQIALNGGIYMLFIYLFFSYRVLYFCTSIFNSLNSAYKRWGVALLISIWIISMLMTSYGWNRIPGVIILILFYRVVENEHHIQRNILKKI